jgi:hypothetical protein
VKAADKINSVVNTINERKKVAENQQQILEIATNMDDIPADIQLVTAARRFIKQGTLGKLARGKLQDRNFYLFNGIKVIIQQLTFETCLFMPSHHFFIKEECNIVERWNLVVL